MPLLFDAHSIALVLLAALAGGLIGLDRTALGQIMLSQPLVTGPFVGWLMGDVITGTVIGAVLELIWVLDMPVGTFVPADSTVGTVAATAIAAIGSGGQAGLDVIGFSILLTTAMVPIIMSVDLFVRKRNSALAEVPSSRDCDDPAGKLARSQAAGLLFFFLKSFVLCLVLVPAGLAALIGFRLMPESVHRGMVLFVKVLPLLGAALVLHKLSFAVLDRFFVLGFAAASLLILLLPVHRLVVILLVVAVGVLAALLSQTRSPAREEGSRR